MDYFKYIQNKKNFKDRHASTITEYLPLAFDTFNHDIF